MNFTLEGRKLLSRPGRILAILAMAALSVYHFVLVWQSITDFVVIRPFIFRDEAITYDGIYSILHPESFKGFMKAVIDGGDHRYGRIIFNISAALSYFPEMILGPAGQIVATRLTQAVFLYAGYLVLLFAFIKNWTLRVLALFLLLAIPTTSYFSYMPKPEPIQLFFLALFLAFHIKRDCRFGWHWLLFGLSLGAKVSVFPIVFVLAVLAYWLDRKEAKRPFPIPKNPRVVGLIAFICGLILAVPVILRGLFTYVDRTFLGAGHGSDSSLISWLDWTTFLFTDYLGTPWYLPFLMVILAAVILWKPVSNFLRTRDLNNRGAQGLLLWCLGAILLVGIMIPVKRLWPHYLHVGIALQIIGLLMIIEFQWKNGPKLVRLAFVLFLCGIIGVQGWFGGKKNLETYAEASQRSRHPAHLEDVRQYRYMLSQVQDLASKMSRRPRVHFDPILYVPDEAPHYIRHVQWGGFDGWNEDLDLIFLHKYQTPYESLPHPSTSHYKDMRHAHDDYLKHVILAGTTTCKERPCYRLLKNNLDNLYGLIPEALYSKAYAQ